MSKFTTEQLAKGRMRFLENHPEIKKIITSLTQEEADALGITLEQLYESETMSALRKEAQFKRVDSAEFFWSYIADTTEELKEIIEASRLGEQRALGL